jgi:TRAP transporter TAXI family solute receptor
MQWVTDRRFAEENNLTSIADLAGFKGDFDLVVNRRGILPSILAEKSMALAGITFEQLAENGGSVQFQGSQAASEIMQDGKAVSWVNATFVGSGSINSIANSRELTLLSVPDDVIAQMQADYGSKPVTIPAGAYEWLDREVKTFGASAALIAADDADPEMVRLVTKAIYQHPEEIQKVHKAMGAFDTTLAASIEVVGYHPLAAEVIAASGN